MERTKDAECSCRIVHDDVLQKVKPQLAAEDELYDMSDIFKTFADPTRLSIIDALIHAELCVCDLAELLALSQPTVSHHLKALRQCRIVKYRRDGKQAYYSLDDEHIRDLFRVCFEHISE